MKFGVLALILNNSLELLAVSRKDDPNDFGLPGGKVEEGESLFDALRREVREETGLEVTSWWPLFGEFNSQRTRYNQTFLCQVKDFNTYTEETGVIKWTNWEEIEKGSFSEYNINLHKVYNKVIESIENEEI